MTQKEAIQILQRLNPLSIAPKPSPEDAIRAIKLAIEALSVELPAGLDEAFRSFMNSTEYPPANQDEERMALDAFKAGAKWMAGQGYTKEETVYFERLCDENRIMVDLGWGEPERGGFNPGDKVVVQIRKAK